VIASALLGLGSEIIKRVIKDPEAQAAAQLELIRQDNAKEMKELEVRMSAIIAEAQSSDPYTSRARPSFMYVFYGVILVQVIIAPAMGLVNPEGMREYFANVAHGFQAIPEELWWTFTAGYLGYGTMRSFEKSKGVSK
jgi:hypothetical protein